MAKKYLKKRKIVKLMVNEFLVKLIFFLVIIHPLNDQNIWNFIHNELEYITYLVQYLTFSN